MEVFCQPDSECRPVLKGVGGEWLDEFATRMVDSFYINLASFANLNAWFCWQIKILIKVLLLSAS